MIKINKKGFTIIELLIATTIFSIILLVATTGIIRIGNLYYKNITSSRTQDAIRAINSELTSTLQFGNNNKSVEQTNGSGGTYFCLDDVRYTYYINKKFETNGDSNSGLISQKLNSGQACNGGSVGETKQMLGNNMRLLQFSLQRLGSGDLWNVKLKISYGDSDLLDPGAGNISSTSQSETATFNCRSGVAGSSFCATAQLDTTVKKRLNGS